MRTPIVVATALLALAAQAFAEEGSALDEEILTYEQANRLEEVVVTPARGPREFSGQTFTTDLVPRAVLSGPGAQRSVQDAVDQLPTVMMQRTAYGQGSPYIRALTGYRNLTLIDGIRLNNSTWRAGPNQYLATVDSYSLDRAEVVFGPGSVLYGSDSMGGTINLLPLRPVRTDGTYAWGGRILSRLASAETSAVVRMEGHGGGRDLGILFGATLKTFGDLEAGDGELPYTGYDEWDADARFLWHATESLLVTFGFQHVNQDGVPRTHKTIYARSWEGTTVGNEQKRELDHERTLLYARAALAMPFSFADQVTATLSWHRQFEERDRVRSDGRQDIQSVEVQTWGLLLSAVTEASFGTLTWGFDGYWDFVDSAADKYDADGNYTGSGIQGPVADDSEYLMLGLYLQAEIPVGDHFTVVPGLRGNWIKVDVGRMEDPATGEPASFSDDYSGVVGSIRFLYDGLDPVGLYGGVSQGFRAPNLSDLTRLDSARSNEFEIPSPGLDPETALSFELGARWAFSGGWLAVTVYDTELKDLIVRVPTGEVVDGDTIVTKDNVGDGYVRGIELTGEVALGAGFALFGGGTWMTGKADTYPTSEPEKEREYLDRLPPLMGNLGLRWTNQAGIFAMARVRAAAKADRLSTRDESDTQRIPPGGTPGYAVFDLQGRFPLGRMVTATVGIENLFDQDYRIHGSGSNMPGRNLYALLEFRF